MMDTEKAGKIRELLNVITFLNDYKQKLVKIKSEATTAKEYTVLSTSYCIFYSSEDIPDSFNKEKLESLDVSCMLDQEPVRSACAAKILELETELEELTQELKTLINC